jgi:transposase
MIKQYRESREEFDKHYHKRSRVESVISVLKRVFGNNLTSKKRRSQRNELHLRTISYNIGITNLTTIKKMVNQLFCHSPLLRHVFYLSVILPF